MKVVKKIVQIIMAFFLSEFFDGAYVADCVAKRVCVGESGRGWL